MRIRSTCTRSQMPAIVIIVVWVVVLAMLLYAASRVGSLRDRFRMIGSEEGNRQPLRDYGRHEGPAEGPAYSAGMYMAGRRPGNRSFCRWSYGLPFILEYSQAKITSSPEAGERGSYRILPFIVAGIGSGMENPGYPGSPGIQLPPLTLCTHATADQVYAIVELARRWEGPISLAVFAPGLDLDLAVALLDRACRCESSMTKVSVHLVFPAGRPPTLGGSFDLGRGDCAASDLQWREDETVRHKMGMTYPINVARNVARTLATTSRVLVSDIELLPSDRLASGFLEMVGDQPPRVAVAFVLPVFEVEAYETPPGNKRDLLMTSKLGTAVYFHRFVCPHCQRFPGLTKWMLRPDPGRVRPLLVTRREFPHHRWEPVFIGTKTDPLYTEELSWEGRQDKMAQMLEMCLLNYRLVVLDGAFLVHTPGIKKKSNRLDRDQRRNGQHEKRNSKTYRNVVRRLLSHYPTNRRCTQ
ncbi:beta-1,4-glucuronyltransferase 1 [Orussus abietinus]|uniref:beta-1,4-glucuronyltransferase 1 n=1 Tax=Orussus abietinus TaxID=222816 RepID=UPI000625B4F6|nr:beta-1,4-glucuronyltransferase 1 [Orussus abietinus]